MHSILGLLNEIRRRPGMFLGRPSLTRLAPFVDGYALAVDRMHGDSHYLLMAEFRDWIQGRYKTTNEEWDTLILRDSKDDADAFDHFGRLLDEFLTMHPEHAPDAATLSPLKPTAVSIASPLEAVKRG